MSDNEIHDIDPAAIKINDIMSFTYYGRVDEIEDNGAILIIEDCDEPGRKFKVEGADLMRGSKSADQYCETVSISKTKAAEKLVESHNAPLTVCFIKADGSLRTIRCKLIRPEPLLGRSIVEDLDVDPSSRIRQIDHRTIQSMIVNGVKYIVK